MGRADIIKLVVSVAACEGAGGIGAIFTRGAIPTWYAGLNKPDFTPPNSAFAPIWISLYLLMGIALFLVWRKGLDQAEVKTAFIIFWVQLALNALWSVVFFGLRSPLGGMVVIIALWIAIMASMAAFLRIVPVTRWLLTPYIVWVSIAAYLNAGIWMLN